MVVVVVVVALPAELELRPKKVGDLAPVQPDYGQAA